MLVRLEGKSECHGTTWHSLFKGFLDVQDLSFIVVKEIDKKLTDEQCKRKKESNTAIELKIRTTQLKINKFNIIIYYYILVKSKLFFI